jgi:hypothetical protein
MRTVKKHDTPWINLTRPKHDSAIHANLGTPATIVLDRSGVVLSKGNLTDEELERAIEAALNKKP